MICFLFNKKILIIYPFFKKRVLAFASFFCVCFFSLNVLFSAVFIKTFYKFFSFLIGKSFWSFLSHGCFNIRLDGIKYGWKLFLKNPFFGVGIGGVGPTRCKEIYNVDLHDLPVGDLKHLDGTNVFMEMLASLGSYGFIAFTVLIVVYFSAFFNLLKNKNISAEQRLNVIAMIISLVVMGITQQFNQNLFRSYIWVYCAICYAYVYKIQFQIKET
jgi:O-antigen ligase